MLRIMILDSQKIKQPKYLFIRFWLSPVNHIKNQFTPTLHKIH